MKDKLSLVGVDCHSTPTGDVKTDDKLVKAEEKLTSGIEKACDGVVLEALGFPGQCTDANGAPFTLADLQQCMLDTHRAQSMDLFNLQAPIP